jgi:hypothetical protein
MRSKNSQKKAKAKRKKSSTKPSYTKQPKTLAATDNPDAIVPWPVWCRDLAGISADTGRRLRKAGKAPRLTHISERIFGVRLSDHRAWAEARVK